MIDALQHVEEGFKIENLLHCYAKNVTLRKFNNLYIDSKC